MVSHEKYDTLFPEVEFLEGWPKDWPTLGMLVPVVFAVGFSILAGFTLTNVPLDQGPFVAVGTCGMVVGMLGAAFVFTSMLPRVVPQWDPGVRRCVHRKHGAGVRSSVSRKEHLRLIPLMTGFGVYGFCAWLDWRSNRGNTGAGNNLLPFSKANDSGATVALVVSIIAAISIILFAILPVFMITIEVYPAGIVRKIPVRFRKDPEQFVPWQEIDSFAADCYSSGNAQDLPIVRVYVNDPSAGPQDKLFDEPGALSLPMKMIRCEPNSFLSIITFLKENPEHRHLLASPGIAQWFLRVQRRNRPFWLKQPRMEDGS